MTPIRDIPTVQRCVLVGAVGLGGLGAVVGLVIGLIGYPPTAWFAALEIGVPAAHLGALLGVVAGLVGLLTRRLRRSLRSVERP